MLVQHHEKYEEIHGVDKIVMMENGEHQALHRRLRKEGKCNISVAELYKISTAAHNRTELRQGRHNKSTKEYHTKNIRCVRFNSIIGPGISVAERIFLNSKTGNVYVSHSFKTRSKLRYIDI